MSAGTIARKNVRAVAAAIATDVDQLGLDQMARSRVSTLTSFIRNGRIEPDILQNLEDTLAEGNATARQFAADLRVDADSKAEPAVTPDQPAEVVEPLATEVAPQLVVDVPIPPSVADEAAVGRVADVTDAKATSCAELTPGAVSPAVSCTDNTNAALQVNDVPAEGDRPFLVVLKRLEEVMGEPCQETAGGCTSRCPAHDDQKPSLSIRETEDGKVLLHCHAGCEFNAILTKLGLKMSDLSKIEAIYTYRDEDNQPLFEKVRFKPKKFLQRRLGEKGEQIWNLGKGWYQRQGNDWKLIEGATNPNQKPEEGAVWFPAVRKVLYRLADVETAKKKGCDIIFVEGEKDADNVAKLGLPATTNPGGASEGWQPGYGDTLRGAKVIFIPDADEPGRKHVEKYAAALSGIAAEVKVLTLPGLPDGKKDISDWLKLGHGKDELEQLIRTTPVRDAGGTAVILDSSPIEIRRPISLIDSHAFVGAWVHVRDNGTDHQALVIVRDDGSAFSDAAISGLQPMSELGMGVHLPEVPPPGRGWSGAGVKKYIEGQRANPADVFRRVTDIVDFFIDFDRSVGSQKDMSDLVALYVMATYFLDAFSVIGYLWPTGEPGSGKTQKLTVITELGYLGCLITAGGSFASLRDMADYGALLAFDDAEAVMDERRTDPDKRALLLAGTRRGTYVTLKEQRGEGNWVTRYVHAYCPRAFSATRLPDPVLGSRTITIPLIRSADREKSVRIPQDHASWPHDRRKLIDDLFALALANLPAVKQCDAPASAKSRLAGRNLEPWRAVLGVAYWLEYQCGVAGLYARMESLSFAYQSEKAELEEQNPVRWVIAGIHEMFKARPGEDKLVFTPSELADVVNRLAADADAASLGEEFTNAKKIGQKLKSLRFERPSGRSSRTKLWQVTMVQFHSLALAYNYRADEATSANENGTNGTNGSTAQPACQCVVDVVPAVLQETPSGSDGIGSSPSPAAEHAVPPAKNDLPWEDLK